MTTTVLLSSDQEDIREVARRYLGAEYDSDSVREIIATEEGFDEERWREMSELGWPAICLPEEHGGMGYSTVERCLLLEEMGRVLLPSPFLSSAVMAADVVTFAAAPEARASLLPAIGEGTSRAALVTPRWLRLEEGPGAVRAAADGDGSTLTGAGGLALDAHTADVMIVVADVDDGTGVFAVDREGHGVSCEPAPTVDPTRRLSRVRFDATPAERIDDGVATAAALEEAFDRATVALAAEMVGAAQRCVDITVEYARDRRQFGAPIGSFQAVKHRCADMSVEADTAREAVYFAADVIESGDLGNLPVAASAAKIAATEAFLAVSAAAIQLHGGIGYTWEHDAHLFYKRALLSARMLGTAAEHRDRLARACHV
jgi:alkylation response protein AidB-like acyl-CoA dehydrogenase